MIGRRNCLRATALLAERSAGLTDAQRLALEDHLQHCGDCAANERDLQALLAGTGVLETPALSERARSRAIAGAVNAAPNPSTRGEPEGRRLPWLVPGIALASAAAAALVITVLGDTGERTASTVDRSADAGSPAAVALVDEREARLIEGDLTTDGEAIAAGSALAEKTVLRSRDGAKLALAHARVELAPRTAVTWNPDAHAVSLRRGRIHTVVDPEPHRPFKVQTGEFLVQVLGTEFEVTTRSVRVMHGAVTIRSRRGKVLVDRLGPGGSWQLEKPRASRRSKAPGKRKGARDEPPAAAEPQEERSADDWITHARRQLAERKVEAARTALKEALPLATDDIQEAEARTLLAECAQVEGDFARAARAYEMVARAYADLPAGENALFAAARAHTRAGQNERASELLRDYLDRYPSGRFHAEAKRRLEAAGP